MSQPAEDEPIELLLETSDDEEEAAGEQVIVDVEGRKRERSVETQRANAQNKRNGLSIAQKAALLDEYDRRASKRQKWGVLLAREVLPKILKDADPSDVYNMDETGLWYRQLPSKTLSKAIRKGVKKAKD